MHINFPKNNILSIRIQSMLGFDSSFRLSSLLALILRTCSKSRFGEPDMQYFRASESVSIKTYDERGSAENTLEIAAKGRDFEQVLNTAKSLLLSVLILLFITSCQDSGCIEADEFGDFETQTITVASNGIEDLCNYDVNNLDSATETELKRCLNAGNPSVKDSSGADIAVNVQNQGCKGFSDITNKKRCADACRVSCLQRIGSAASTSTAEPNYSTTNSRVDGKNDGVTIYPGSQISIRAIGQVNLSDAVLNNVSKDIPITNTLPFSPYQANADNSRIEGEKGINMSLEIYGAWKDGEQTSGIDNKYGTESTSKITTKITSIFSSSDEKYRDAINMLNKLVFYAIPHPPGYTPDYSSNTEKNINSQVPLVADGDAWKCEHDNDNIKNEKLKTYCESSDYNAIGYVKADNQMSSDAFPITTKKEDRIKNYGGFLRYNNDGIEAEDSDEFVFNKLLSNSSQINECCDANNNYERSKIDTIFNNQNNKLNYQTSNIFDLSNSGNISPAFSVKAGSKLYLRNLSKSTNPCGEIWIKLSENNDSNFPSALCSDTENKCIKLTNDSYNSYHKYFSQDTTIYLKSESGGNCSKYIGAHSAKLNSIIVPTSGYVSFKIVGASGYSAQCTINADIINQDGSFETDSNNSKANIKLTVNDNNFSSFPSNKKYYLRKNQKLIFNPESWNGEFQTNISSVSKKCGVGMAMYIEPRPALVCIGKASENIKNFGCNPLLDSTSYQRKGCVDFSQCSESSNTNYYCPSLKVYANGNDLLGASASSSSSSSSNTPVFCDIKLSCTDEGDTNRAASGCTLDPSTPRKSDRSSNCDNECIKCASEILTSRQVSPVKSISNINQCYDLEEYNSDYYTFNEIAKRTTFTGASSSNCTPGAGTIECLLANKGLRKLDSSFNGIYSNFADSELKNSLVPDSINTANGYPKFELKRGLNFNSRINLMILDGEDISFNSPDSIKSKYSNNVVDGKFAIISKSDQVFKNGKNLQVALCIDKDDKTYSCSIKILSNIDKINSLEVDKTYITSKSTSSNHLNDQNDLGKSIYNISDYSSMGSSNYIFDENGNLKRKSNIISKDCTTVTSDYFCHRFFDILKTDNEDEKKIKSDNSKLLRLAFKIHDPDGDYSNNSGSYQVTIKSKIPQSQKSSNYIGEIINLIIGKIDGNLIHSSINKNVQNNIYLDLKVSQGGIAANVYTSLVGGTYFRFLLQMSVILAVMFFGLGYFIGTIELKQEAIVKLIFKIGFIYWLVDPFLGWSWFQEIFGSAFKGGTDYIAFNMASVFNSSSGIAKAIANYDSQGGYSFSDKSVLFSSVDDIIGLFFNNITQKKVLALFFSQLFGWLYMIIIYYSMLIYFYAVANTVLIYLTAQFFTSILFTLGPIFLIFLLFSATKEMFDNWLKALLGFSLQQIFLVTTLSFFNMLMYNVIKMSLGYRICWDTILTFSVGSYQKIDLLSFWTVAGSNVDDYNQIEGISTVGAGVMPSLYSMFYILIIATLMRKFVIMMSDIASKIAGGIKATNIGKDIATKFSELEKSMIFGYNASSGTYTGAIPYLYKSSLGKLVSKVDDKLFDSGEAADKRRQETDLRNTQDTKQISDLSKAGNRAVSEFKANNGDLLAKMSKEQQREKLKEVRDNGIKNRADDLGIDPSNTSRLMNKSGLLTNYQGTNLFGAALSAAGQAARGRAFTSLNDQKVKTSFSQQEAQDAIKNLYDSNDADKNKKIDDFIDATKSNIKVKRSNIQYMGDVLRKPTTEVSKVAKSVGSVIKEKASDVKKFVYHNEEKTEARKFLEENNLISKIGFGRGFLRTKKEKDLIKQQMQEDIKNNSSISNKTSDVNAVAELENYRKSLDENGVKEKTKGAASRALKKVIGYKGSYAGIKVPGLKNEKEEILKNKVDLIPDKIQKEIDSVGIKIINTESNKDLTAPEKERGLAFLEQKMQKLESFKSVATYAKQISEQNQTSGNQEELEKDYIKLKTEKDFKNFVEKYKPQNSDN